MDLHPYDGKERRFRHTDPDPSEGLVVVATLLGLQHPPSGRGLRYDLSFFSGGIGVLDRLAITMQATRAQWAAAARHLAARGPADLAADPEHGEDFRWLVQGSLDAQEEVRAASVRFIDEERARFQRACLPADTILFGAGSNVNDWCVIWGRRAALHYLGYSQG